MMWLIFCGIIICFLIWVYNKIVRLENLFIEAESGVEVQLKRRYDLVPNLVRVITGYCAHETKMLEDVTILRTKAMTTEKLAQKECFENQFEQGICTILMLKEDYPDLKANDMFNQLQKDLVLIEDDLQHARRYYNGIVRKFNTFINLFPICLFQKILKVSTKPFFQLDGVHEKNVPSIKECLND
ncbi:MAG: LemA family protein [Alphaproteobacteria bacterium]|nr:LemA family protein [Alphaproteobacteria bacterium]